MPKPDVSAERKAAILESATHVFLKKGFDAARMEEIAEGAGLSVGGVYWYYKSKEEIIHDLMDDIINTDLADLRALLAAPGTVIERLKSYIRTSVPPTEALEPLFYEIYSLGGRDPLTHQRLREYFRTYRAIVAELLAQGVARGEFRPLDIDHCATLFAALYEGVLEMTMLDPINVHAIPELENALDSLLRGLHP